METAEKKEEQHHLTDEDFGNCYSSDDESVEETEELSDDDSEDGSFRGGNRKNKAKKPLKKTKKTCLNRIVMNISDTQYEVVRFVGKKIFNWKLSSSSNDAVEWDIMWTDNAVQSETLARMQTFQRINHFPGMYSLARKNHLGRNLMRMKKAFPNNYKFFPPTYLLPSEFNEFRNQFTKKKNKTFIIKPEASCQGRGIFLTRTWEAIAPGEHYVAQRYLHKPFLIDGLKFDMRIYVLLAGCDPLKIFLFDDGLGRFATEEYVSPTGENLDNVCMHLTNYAINKNNPNFVFNDSAAADDVGHKKSLKAVMRILRERGHDVDGLWKEIRKIIIKTFCSVQPILAHTYKSCHPDEPYNNMCFEILGFDIMLDQKLKPWLIEINHTPSFTTDTPLDKSIKKNCIADALRLMNINVEDKIKAKNLKRVELQQRVLTGKKIKPTAEEKQAAFERAQKERTAWEAVNHGRYEKIYPFDNPADAEEDYEEFMRVAKIWWEDWTGLSKRRNIKKENDPNKPPPMVFGQGNSSVLATKMKEVHAVYTQKLKPSPSFNTKTVGNSTAASVANKTSQVSVNNNSTPSKTNTDKINDELSPRLVEDLDQLEAKLDAMDQQIDENVMENLAVIKDEEDQELVGEDHTEEKTNKKVQEIMENSIERNLEEMAVMSTPLTPERFGKKAYVLGSKERLKNLQKIEDRTFKLESEYIFKDRSASLGKAVNSSTNESSILVGPARKNTSFRIKPMNSMKESPQQFKQMLEKADYDEQKMNILKNFASYLAPEKGESAYESIKKHYYKLNNVNNSKDNNEEETEEKFISIKRIPIRGPVLGHGSRNTEYNNWPSPSKLSTLDIQANVKPPVNHHVMNMKHTGRNEYNTRTGGKGRGFSPVYQKGRNVGVYVAPKMYELHLNLSAKEDSINKSQMNQVNQMVGTGLAVNGVGTSGKIYSKIMTQQREHQHHIHHYGSQNGNSPFVDHVFGTQKYHNFLTNIKK